MEFLGVFVLATNIQLAITNIEYGINDRVEVVTIVGDNIRSKTKNKIRYTNEEEAQPYIIKNNHKYFLNEFIRIIK